MEVDEDYLSLDLLQKFVGEPEGIVAGSHKDASLEIDYGVAGAIFLTFIHSPARHTRWKICGTQQPSRGTVRVVIRHLEVFDDLALVPDVIAGRHNVDAEIKEFVREPWRDAESRCRILAISDDQIDGVLLYQPWQAVLYDRSPRAAKNVTDEENVQEAGLRCQVSGLRNSSCVAESSPNF